MSKKSSQSVMMIGDSMMSPEATCPDCGLRKVKDCFGFDYPGKTPCMARNKASDRLMSAHFEDGGVIGIDRKKSTSNRRLLAAVPPADLPKQLRIDADEMNGIGAGNEAEYCRQAAYEIERLRSALHLCTAMCGNPKSSDEACRQIIKHVQATIPDYYKELRNSG